MALDFVVSFGGAADSRAVRHGVLRRLYEYLVVYDPQTEFLERKAFPRSSAIAPPRILSEAELTWLIDACGFISPGNPQGPHDGDANRIVGLYGITIGRSGQP